MNAWVLYAAASAGVFAAGLSAAFDTTSHAIRRVLGVNIMASGVFLLLVASARRASSELSDPVPHALVLTGIVVSVSGTGLAVAIARRLNEAREQRHVPNAPDEVGRRLDGGRR
jgi:multicomponent Na+:H+ antiporter subunit C